MDLVPVIDQAAVLRAVGLDPNLPQTHALLLIAQKYSLDPLLGHIFIVPTKAGPRPYISRDAQLHIAHRSGMFDGMKTTIEVQGKQVYATCEVYRKDMRVPFSFTASCESPDSKGRDPRMMAIARAERNALKRAFDITVDVYDPDETPATVSEIHRSEPVTLPEYHEPAETAALPVGVPAVPQQAAERAPEGEPVEPPAAPQNTDSERTLKLRARMIALGFTAETGQQLIMEVTRDRTSHLRDLDDEEVGTLIMRLRRLEKERA